MEKKPVLKMAKKDGNGINLALLARMKTRAAGYGIW